MININGESYYSYAEAIIALQKVVKDLEEKIPDISDYVTKEILESTLTDYAKKSDIPDVSSFVTEATMNAKLEAYAKLTDLSDYAKETELDGYVKSTDSGYTKLQSDNDLHNANWESMIADLGTLE